MGATQAIRLCNSCLEWLDGVLAPPNLLLPHNETGNHTSITCRLSLLASECDTELSSLSFPVSLAPCPVTLASFSRAALNLSLNQAFPPAFFPSAAAGSAIGSAPFPSLRNTTKIASVRYYHTLGRSFPALLGLCPVTLPPGSPAWHYISLKQAFPPAFFPSAAAGSAPLPSLHSTTTTASVRYYHTLGRSFPALLGLCPVTLPPGSPLRHYISLKQAFPPAFFPSPAAGSAAGSALTGHTRKHASIMPYQT